MSVRKGGKIIAGSSGYRPGIFTYKWSDHILNDVQQLLANTFSWQYASIYEAAYNKLAEEFTPDALYCWGDASNKYYTRTETPEIGDVLLDENGDELTPTTTIYAVSAGYISFSYSDSGTTYSFTQPRYATGDIDGLESETINGVTVRFFISKNKFKISPASQESAINSIFQNTGEGWYYIIDKTNQRFKLPRERSREIIENVKNPDGSWYRLYADGWVEQGGKLDGLVNGSSSWLNKTVNLPIQMADTNYSIIASDCGFGQNTTHGTYNLPTSSTQWSYYYYNASNIRVVYWRVSGMSNVNISKLQKGKKYLYFYVGNFTQTALQNIAGSATETLNNKVDKGFDIIDFQEPTAENSYTWYKKYRNGWVEQGGRANGNKTVSLPITMSDANYETIINVLYDNGGAAGFNELGYVSKTTTSFTKSGNANVFNWVVYGRSAQ